MKFVYYMLLMLVAIGCEQSPEQTQADNNRCIQLQAERLSREAKERRSQEALDTQVRIRQYQLEH